MYASRIGADGEALTYGRKAGAHSPEQLARQYMPLVRKIAWHVHGRVSNAMEIEDLLQIGMVALVEALGGFAAVSSLDPTTAERGISAVGLMWQVGASGLQVLIYPLLYCVLTVANYDLRVRKEAFDLEVLAAGLSRA